jgi:hypothetical protein
VLHQPSARDHQWFVRLRTVRALANFAPGCRKPLHQEIRECLRDPHWRVREAAIQTLISLGQGGKHHLYEYFLTCPDHTTREQIVEVIERTGLMSDLVEEYSAGTKGVEALMVEQLASDAAPMGLSGILRTLEPGEPSKDSWTVSFPYAEATMRFPPSRRLTAREEELTSRPPARFLEFPPHLAA